MTNENMIKQLKRLIPSLQYADDVNAVKGAIKALSQEPRYWIGKDGIIHKLVTMELVPDAVSREDRIIDLANAIESDDSGYWTNKKISSALRNIKNLPPVTPQQKTGHWIHFAQSDDCSECGWSTGKYISPSNYCPNCGCRMVEPQERSEKE